MELRRWRRVFYPNDLPESHWLEFYSGHFPAVEVDSTFHAAPSEVTVRRWAETTPASFRFTCKLPRQITHICRLRDCGAELSSFLRAIELLGPKLQVILIQLPPSLTPADGKHALRKFLAQLPRDFRFAVEFRHAGRHRPQFIRLVERYRVCWVWADTTPIDERNLAPFEFLPCTTDFLYLRLLGDYATKYDVDGGHVHRYGKLLWKREAALESWSLKVQRHLADVRMSGHSPAITLKGSHWKRVNASPNASGSLCRCRKQKTPFLRNENRSSIYSCSATSALLCFSKMQTWRMPISVILRARLAKFSPSWTCECASEAVVNGIPFSMANRIIESLG